MQKEQTDKITQILILGNGFDLAHGLNTKYSDFLDYCKNKYSINNNGSIRYKSDQTNNLWLRHFIKNKPLNDRWIDLETEIYNIIKNINFVLFKHRDIRYVEQYFPRSYDFSVDDISNDFNLYNIMNLLKKNTEARDLCKREYFFLKDNDI